MFVGLGLGFEREKESETGEKGEREAREKHEVTSPWPSTFPQTPGYTVGKGQVGFRTGPSVFDHEQHRVARR